MSTSKTLALQLDLAIQMVAHDNGEARAALEHQLYATKGNMSDEQVLDMFSRWEKAAIPPHPLEHFSSSLEVRPSGPQQSQSSPLRASTVAATLYGGTGRSIDQQLETALCLIRTIAASSRSGSTLVDRNGSTVDGSPHPTSVDDIPTAYAASCDYCQGRAVLGDDQARRHPHYRSISPVYERKNRIPLRSNHAPHHTSAELDMELFQELVQRAPESPVISRPRIIDFGTVVSAMKRRQHATSVQQQCDHEEGSFSSVCSPSLKEFQPTGRPDESSPGRKHYAMERLDFFVRRSPCSSFLRREGSFAADVAAEGGTSAPHSPLLARERLFCQAPDWLPQGCEQGKQEGSIGDHNCLSHASISPEKLKEVVEAARMSIFSKIR